MLVGGLEGLGDLDGDLDSLLRAHGPLPKAVGQVLALQVFHGDERLTVCFPSLVDLAHEGVIELGARLRLEGKPLANGRLVLDTHRQELEGDLAIEKLIAGQQHFAHASPAQDPQDLVVAEDVPWSNHGVRPRRVPRQRRR